jgi:drug/metabolite transporter (DMT)-like permease
VLEGVAAGLGFEALVGTLMWAWAGSVNTAVGLLLGLGGCAAYAAGWAVIKHRMVLTPRHPPVPSPLAPAGQDHA